MTELRRVPAAEANHAAFDHEQLKRWTDEADPDSAQRFADEWTRPGAALMEAADTLRRACAQSESGWTGAAAEAMRARLGQISRWSGDTGAQIAAASQSVARQSEAADAARRAMPEPVPYDPARLIREAGQGGLVGFAALPQQLLAQKQRHDAAHAEAIRVVAERDSAMNTAAAQVAVFEPPPVLDPSGAPGGPTPGGPAPVAVAAPHIPRQGRDSGVAPVGEDQRPEVLQDPGADGIFAHDVRTAPPVIGGSGD